MAENLFADLADQHVELLPARTVLTTLAWDGGDDDHGDSAEDNGNGNAGAGLLGGISLLNPTA